MPREILTGLQEVALNRLKKALEYQGLKLEREPIIDYVANTAVVCMDLYDINYEHSTHNELGQETYVYVIAECGTFKRIKP